jgi:cellobiose-specific phosphotransferase system component IIA
MVVLVVVEQQIRQVHQSLIRHQMRMESQTLVVGVQVLMVHIMDQLIITILLLEDLVDLV